MNPKNIVVLDLETQKSFKEIGKGKLEKLKVSTVGIYDYLTDQYVAYEEKDLIQLEKRFQDIGLIIGFNIRRFDMPVLAPYLFTSVEQLPQLDLLEEIQKVRGHRVSLDSVAAPTLNQRKSGTGVEALVLFRENRMEELKKYCLDDVRLTKDIYEYGCREEKILFTSTKDYKTYEVPVCWKELAEQILQKKPAQEAKFPSSLF